MRTSIVLSLACLIELTKLGCAQRLSIGILGGASLTQDFQDQAGYSYVGGNSLGEIAYSTPKRWIAGAMVAVQLPLNLAIEADGLYHELGFTTAAIFNGTVGSGSPATVVTWEVPVLAKYRFSVPVVKPFVEAGPSFRASYNLNSACPSNRGFTAGAGVEARLWKVRIAPQFRYIRWARDRFDIVSSTLPDQVEFLLGVSF